MSAPGILVLASKVPENNQDDFPISRSVTACLGMASSDHRRFPRSRISDRGLRAHEKYLALSAFGHLSKTVHVGRPYVNSQLQQNSHIPG